MHPSALHSIFAVVCLGILLVPMRSHADDAAPTQAQFGEENPSFSQVDSRTGAMTYSYAFELPSARGLSGPTLALRYNSSMGDGNVAYGWSLSVPTIERRTLSGLPRSTASGDPIGAERYAFDGQPLVKICQIGGACPSEPSTSGHPAWAEGWSYFRLQNEGLFARFYMSPARTTFRAVFKGGDMVEFGLPLEDGGFATFGLDTNIVQWTEQWDNGITRWLPSIRRSLNHPNNAIAYRWAQLGARGIAYLTDIWDTPPSAGASSPAEFEHHAQLTWAPVPNPGFSHAPPFRARPDFRLERVGVASMPWSGTAPREIYRQYILSYKAPRGPRPGAGWAASPELSPLWQHTFLRQILVQGHCAGNVEDANGGIPERQCGGLPPVSFEYEPATPTTFDSYAPTIQSGPPNIVADKAVLPDPANAGVFDFDRDGRPDVVQSWPERCAPNGTKYTVMRQIDDSFLVVCRDESELVGDQILRSTRPMLGYRNVGPTIADFAGHAFSYTCMDAGPTTDPFSLSSAQTPQGPPFGDRLPGFFASNGNTTLGAFGSGGAIWGQNAYFPVFARFVQSAPGGVEPAASGCHLNGSFDPNSFTPSWRWQTMAVEPWQKRSPRALWENSVPEWNVDIDGDGYPDRLAREPGPTLGVYARATAMLTYRYAKSEHYPLPPPSVGEEGDGPALVPFAYAQSVVNSIVPVEPHEVWDPAVNAFNRQRVYYTDINGDGFPDAVSRDYLNGGNQPILVRPGDGKGNFHCSGAEPFACTDEVLGGITIASHYELDIAAPFKPWELPPGVSPSPWSFMFFEFADVTGDGLSDIVRLASDGAIPRVRVEVWVNRDGHRFECMGAPADPCLAGYANVEGLDKPRLTFADMNSDGVNDIVVLSKKGAVVGSFNAMPTQAASGARAVRPGQLIRIANGRGTNTEVKYATLQELEREAEVAGSPWTHRSPVVESVVTELRTHNGVVGGPMKPAPFGIDRYMRFTYREPGYDNWERRFVGFRKVAVRTGNDLAVTETTYWLGPCQNGDTPAEGAQPFCPETSDDESLVVPSHRAWVGKPMRVDRYVPATPNQQAARYLWSRTFEYDPPQVLFGPSPSTPSIDRHVTFAFAKRIETHLYDVESETVPGYSYPTLFGGDDIELAPGQAGHRIVASTVLVDSNGTTLETESLGEEPYDLAHVTQYSTLPYGVPPQVTCDASWNCLPTEVTRLSRSGTFGATTVHRKQRYTYLGADLKKAEAELDTDQFVTRYHPAGAGAYSEFAPRAAGAGWKTRFEGDYSPDGVLVLAKGPGDSMTPHRACARSALDERYGHFPSSISAFTDACDAGPALVTELAFDRDFGVPVTTTGPDLSVSMTVLDLFGRVEATFAPLPDGTVGATRQATGAIYLDGGAGVSPWIEVRTYTSTFGFIRSVDVLNTSLESTMTFQQADGSAWTVQGWTERDAAGRARLTRRPFGTPAASLATAQSGGSVPLPTYGGYEQVFDDFGRSVSTKENGVKVVERKLAPLAIEVRDQEQLPGGGHVGAFTRVETNGHGEVVHTAKHGNGGVIDTWNALDGMGRPSAITRSGPGAPDYIRSMVWDSFDRMVENAEWNTMDRATGRTIRYAFDDNNRLAGTSDGRGCGEDFYYDSLGRVVGEDYSPCLASQPEYTPYVPLGSPNGLEVEYRYDAYDPAQVFPEPGFSDDPGLAAGRLASRVDRGADTHFNYDSRGRTMHPFDEPRTRISRPDDGVTSISRVRRA